ncbi:MAG: hypothetical protein JNM81_11255 [Rhodospirillaceae bacterium]|nr:hypothetical protein [Rhodospirillaceae bacterium]
MAKKSEYVLNIGDDNVVLIRFVDKRMVNAWLASPDPATALEELGEALAEDKKGRVSVIIDTLDQAFKEEEVPKVNILDRRKILSRHITMAFPGQSMRGARLVGPGERNTLLYEFASVPLDGRIPGWIEFYESLPNEKGGVYAIASENVDIVTALAPKVEPPVPEAAKDSKEAAAPQQNHWQHFIGINVTGGLRQIIAKNGRLSLTRLTQAPPPDTPPDEFADMIVRDFKATITYLRRLGYSVGEPLDLVVLTTAANRAALENMEWTGARGVTLLTPYEAGAMLNLGAIGPEDQAYSDVLHAAWFVNKRAPNLKLTRSVSMGDLRDDLRDLAFVAAPYAAGVIAASVIGWTGITAVDYFSADGERDSLSAQLSTFKASLSKEEAQVSGLPVTATQMRNVFDVEASMDRGKIDTIPLLVKIYESLESDAIVLDLKFAVGGGIATGQRQGAAAAANPAENYSLSLQMKLSNLVTTADEAVQAARRLQQRLVEKFGKEYTVTMVKEPVAAQSATNLSGDLFGGSSSEVATSSGTAARSDEPFFVEFLVARGLAAKGPAK